MTFCNNGAVGGCDQLLRRKNTFSLCLRDSLFFIPSIQQSQIKNLIYLLRSARKKVEGSLFYFYSNILNAKLEKHREETAASSGNVIIYIIVELVFKKVKVLKYPNQKP